MKLSFLPNFITYFFRLTHKLMRAVTPKNSCGDYLVSLWSFVKIHRRFPTSNLLFNDVLFHMKVNGVLASPLRVFVSDKEYLKIFIKAVVGDEFNVPTLAILRSEEQLRTYSFPESCCVKPTHASGRVFFKLPGDKINYGLLYEWFSKNYYLSGREINYKNLDKKLIVEPILFDNTELNDYKFFCWNGKARLVQVDFSRLTNHTRKIYDIDWIEQDYGLAEPRNNFVLDKPVNYNQMINLVETIAGYFPGLVRVDLYNLNGQIFVGEITNCHGNVEQKFMPRDSEIIASKILFE